MGQDMKKVSTGYMGLLEMARRSGNSLITQFDEVNEEYSYYTLTVRVRAKGFKGSLTKVQLSAVINGIASKAEPVAQYYHSSSVLIKGHGQMSVAVDDSNAHSHPSLTISRVCLYQVLLLFSHERK